MTQAEVHQRRSNKRGLATRQTMLDAAVRSLASGDPGAVSATRIAKESGATWGAVQYQFGDVDGFWAAVLHRSEEHTSELHHITISYAVFCLKKKKKKKKRCAHRKIIKQETATQHATI